MKPPEQSIPKKPKPILIFGWSESLEPMKIVEKKVMSENVLPKSTLKPNLDVTPITDTKDSSPEKTHYMPLILLIVIWNSSIIPSENISILSQLESNTEEKPQTLSQHHFTKKVQKPTDIPDSLS